MTGPLRKLLEERPKPVQDIMEETLGPLDRAERLAEEELESKRPLREKLEEHLKNVPEGPLGKGGEGDVLGLAAFIVSSLASTPEQWVKGLRMPGYHVISHSSEDKGNYVEHVVRINAISGNVAQFAAEYFVASPSNIDFLTSEVDTVSIEEIHSRATYSTWEIVVHAATRGEAYE